ncbi:MAG TPA: CPBP family intramembrane glutamic endopeptidase [Blastocatellia bacterium]|nr:CPBP family intramembrane glutamic endopeptidase [Blastocatellia bacterium]
MTREADGQEVEAILKIVTDSLMHLITKPGIILISVFLLLIVWGPKGEPIFMPWFREWIEATPLHRQFRVQLLSYASGVLLLVVTPVLIIRFRFKESLSKYGLGLGDVRLGLLFMAVLIVVSLPLFFFGARSPQMQAEYPLIYRGLDVAQIRQQFQWQSFLLYELIYASFFLVIEFTFRGYMLFGLREKFGLYSILIQMLSYTAWHLAKPVPELIGTPVWGFAVAAVTLRVRSIWYVFVAHWLLNVFLDVMILINIGVFTGSNR